MLSRLSYLFTVLYIYGGRTPAENGSEQFGYFGVCENMASANRISQFDVLKTSGEHLTYSRKEILGIGAYAIVYRGVFKGITVAVKKIDLDRLRSENTEIAVQQQLNHENILKIIHVEEDFDFRYYKIFDCLKSNIMTWFIQVHSFRALCRNTSACNR